MQAANRLVSACLVALAFGVLAGCATEAVHSKSGTTTTVILLRHADRDEHSEQLNAQGRARAQALVAAVRDRGVTAIYSPNVERNVDTVKPLAQHLGIDITLTPRFSMPVANRIAREILDKHAGGVVVLVGNLTGNLQAFYHLLGGTGSGPEEYGDLYIMTIPDQGPVKVNKMRFGS
jgi:hypothetical protein